MKKIFILLLVATSFVACKKKTTTPTSTTNNSSSNNSDTISVAKITGFIIDSLKINGSLANNQIAHNVFATIKYTGGNGKTYPSVTFNSTGVNGLKANLYAGILATGIGKLMFYISGTPEKDGTATFIISLGGKDFTINLQVIKVSPGPNIIDIEGNSYKTVTIGTQTWFAENLKITKYNDGTSIPIVKDNKQWQYLTNPAYNEYIDTAANSKYGKLYNWYAINPTTNGNKNVCPIGWHVPTDTEWTLLTDYLGGESVAGGKMKIIGTKDWKTPNTGATNLCMFNAFPSGGIGLPINNGNIGGDGNWWSTTEYTKDSESAFSRILTSYNSVAKTYINNKKKI